MRFAAVSLALAISCYSPRIDECTIQCSTDRGCPADTSCGADNYCHADSAVSCRNNTDGGSQPDAPIDSRTADGPRPFDGPLAQDGPRAPDAPVLPDAPRRDAPAPDAPSCIDIVATVDEGGAFQVANLSVGAQDDLHITYVDSTTRRLRYAHRLAGETWKLEDITEASAILKGQTIDAHGALHVAYSVSRLLAATELRHLRRTPDAEHPWAIETVNAEDEPLGASIAVDAADTVHIAYYGSRAGELVYAERAAGASAWTRTVVDNGDDGNVGEFPSLAIGPSGRIYISYRDVDRLDLRMATRGDAGWGIRSLDTSGNAGSYTALAVDNDERVHIAYGGSGGNELRYLRLAPPAEPVRLTADKDGQPGRFNALALDRKGNVHISTYANAPRDLRYERLGAGANNFVVRPLDTAGNVGRYSSLGVDSAGGVHVAYIDDSHNALKYAYICPR